MKISAIAKKVPVLGGFLDFLGSPTGSIFKQNLREQKALTMALLGLSNVMAFITGARALLMVAFLQVITGADTNVIPESWFAAARPYGFAWIESFHYGKIVTLAAALVALSLVNFLAEYWQKAVTAIISVRFVAAQRRLITEYTMKYDASFFSQSRISEVNATFGLFTTAISNILNYAQHAMTCLLRMAMVLAVIFFLDPALTIAIIAAAACLLPIMTRMQKRIHHVATDRRMFDIKSGALFSDFMYGMRLIKQSNQQDRFKGEYYSLTDNRDDRQVAYARASALANSVTQVFAMITIMAVACTVFILKEFSIFSNIGFILGYIVGVQRFFSEVSVAVNYYTAIGQEVPHLNAMNKVLADETILESYHFAGTKKDFTTNSFSVRDCSFAYHPGVPVLKNVSLEAKAGEITAVLGLSGSGKSTLFELMAGYRAARPGEIVVGDSNLSDIDIKTYRARTGYLTQDTLLFNMSVRENIAFIKTGATQAEIEQAAEKAQAAAFIRELRDGYDTSVGDRGGHVSGGQRQRLAIARMFLHDPEVLFMDEATSGLDFISEQKIMKTLFNDVRTRGKVLFVATHRLVTVASADQIIFINKGEIAERGTHEQLMQRGGLYHDLYHFQTQIEGMGLENGATEAA